MADGAARIFPTTSCCGRDYNPRQQSRTNPGPLEGRSTEWVTSFWSIKRQKSSTQPHQNNLIRGSSRFANFFIHSESENTSHSFFSKYIDIDETRLCLRSIKFKTYNLAFFFFLSCIFLASCLIGSFSMWSKRKGEGKKWGKGRRPPFCSAKK